MGRLFWKFFVLISLAQLAAILGIGHTLWLHTRADRDAEPRVAYGAPAEFMVGSAAETLQTGGVSALRALLESHKQPIVFALDESNRELLGRTVSGPALQQARRTVDTNPDSRAVRHVQGADGHRYLLFAPTSRFEGGWPPNSLRFPIIPTIATLVGSLICAALLARYLSKPIRNLRLAFDSAASGKLDVRVSPLMEQRNDELANLGRDFDRMAARLQSLMDNQRRLFHAVSHELRSPLARLQIAAGLARQHPDTVQGALERVERECKRIDELVGELLTLSKLETGVMGAVDDELDLNKLVGDIVSDARFESQTNGHRIVFDDQAPAVVRGQPELLHRAIENVIRNALKHTPDGTTIWIGTAATGGEVRVTISDDGPGVSAEEFGSIFQPFFRGSATLHKQGNGLGLSIARQVVEAHGGAIAASNREGGGLKVDIRLKSALAKESEASVELETSPAQ